jgi:hypothetical protein
MFQKPVYRWKTEELGDFKSSYFEIMGTKSDKVIQHKSIVLSTLSKVVHVLKMRLTDPSEAMLMI